MLLQRIMYSTGRRRRVVALLALAIVALVALNPSTGRGQGFADLPLTITSTPANAYTYAPNESDYTNTYLFNVEEGQEVTYRFALKNNVPPAGTTQIRLVIHCECMHNARIVSYTLGAGTDAASKTAVGKQRAHTRISLSAPPATAYPIEVTIKGLRVSRRTWRDVSTPSRGLGTYAFSLNTWWHDGSRWVHNTIYGGVVVSERAHPADESTHRFVHIGNAANVMKGEDLRYPVKLLDRNGNAVNATEDINLVVNTRLECAYCRIWGNPNIHVALINHGVTIPSGSSSTTITVRTRGTVTSRPVDRIVLKAYLLDYPSGVKFSNTWGFDDASGKIVDGTAFSLSSRSYFGIEGHEMPVAIHVHGNVNAGEFVLRVNFSFWSSEQQPRAADRNDLGDIGHYDCRLNPKRNGTHLIVVPVPDDNIAEMSEVFDMHLSLISAPDGVTADVSARSYHNAAFRGDRAYGFINERAHRSPWATTPISDCLPDATPSSAPPSQPLQSPISFSATEIVLSEGTSFSYDVTLNSDPGEHTVTVSPLSVDVGKIKPPAPLSFTSANWNQPQAVIVTAESDADNADDEVAIGHLVEGTSGAPFGPVVFATVTEQPTLGLDLRQPTQRSFGSQPFFVYWVRLDRQPSSDVVVELAPASDSVDVHLHTNSLSFSSENWDHYQIVVLNPLDSTVGSELKINHSAATHAIHAGESVSATITSTGG